MLTHYYFFLLFAPFLAVFFLAAFFLTAFFLAAFFLAAFFFAGTYGTPLSSRRGWLGIRIACT